MSLRGIYIAVVWVVIISGAFGRNTRQLFDAVSSFRNCAQGVSGLKVVYQGDGEYEKFRQRISNPRLLSFKYPAAFAFPTSSKQAASLIKCTNMAAIKIAVRGGGHNYEGLSIVNGGVVIDTSMMLGIKKWSRNGEDVATIEAGQRIGPVNSQLFNLFNLFFPTGVCDSVGIVGVALGGGIGPNLRKTGLTTDALVQAKLVTASGKVMTVDSSRHSDLFWALRGGGGNVALVISLTFRLSTPPPKVSVLQVAWSDSRSNMRNLLDAYFKWAPFNLPDEYSYVELFLGKGGSCRLVVYYWGPRSDLQSLYDTNDFFEAGSNKKLEQLKELTFENFLEYMMNPWSNIPLSQMTTDEVVKRAFDDNPGRSSYKASSAFLNTELDGQAMDQLVDVVYRNKDKAWIQVHPLGGAVSRIGETETAFPHRNAKYQFQIYIYEDNEGWIQEVQSALRPAATGLQYLNYVDTDTANPWETYFGPNAQRMQDIEKKWDPNNVFDALYQR